MESIRTMLLGISLILCAVLVVGLTILFAESNIFLLVFLLALASFLLGAGLRFGWVGYDSELEP